MPQEMSSGGMDRWILVHGEKNWRAKREEEEECGAAENGEWIPPLSSVGHLFSGSLLGFLTFEGENIAPRLVELSPALPFISRRSTV